MQKTQLIYIEYAWFRISRKNNNDMKKQRSVCIAGIAHAE